MPQRTMRRVAFVTNVLAHYRVRCFEALAARLPGRIDFFLLTKSMAHRRYVLAQPQNAHPFPLHVLPGKAFGHPPYDDVHLNDPRPVLNNYDLIVLSGWIEPTFLLLWLLAHLKRTRVAFWIESTLHDAPRDTLKESFKRLLLRGAVGAVTAGTHSAAYCESLGMPRNKIFIAPNAADSAYFGAQAQILAPQREQLRAELNLQGVVILFVGRMVDAFKNVATLLAAQRELEQKNLDAQLVLIGEGADRARYESLVQEWNLHNVRFVNFMAHDALCRYYAAADIFVLPSRVEPWGFVLNEAMEFSLPLVVSNRVGAVPDLVCPNENGFLISPDDALGLATALETLVRDAPLRARMGARSREIIARHTPDAWADGFANALETMLQ